MAARTPDKSDEKECSGLAVRIALTNGAIDARWRELLRQGALQQTDNLHLRGEKTPSL